MSKTGRLALGSLLVFVLVTMVGSVVLGLVFDPDRIDPEHRYLPPGAAHWLGTDALGRDVLIRLLLGARASLLVAASSALIATALGTAVGSYAGYRGGRADQLFLRFTDVFRTVPKLPLFILLAALDLGRLLPLGGAFAEAVQLVLVMSLISWVFVARTTRGVVLELKSRNFVLAARSLGLSERRIVQRHLLPHAAGTIAVTGALLFGDLVVYESVLSYLGLGFQPPAPSLGSLMRNGLAELDRAPALTVLPGLLTLWLLASVHFLVDAHAEGESGNRGRGVGEGAGSG